MARTLLLYTDLDGTLLNHHDFNFEAALPLLKNLHNSGVILVPNSSKTLAEISLFLSEIDLDLPFIIENGSAVFIPKSVLPDQPEGAYSRDEHWVREFAITQDEIRRKISGEIYQKFQADFSLLSDLPVPDQSKALGLTGGAILAALDRYYTDLFIWHGDDKKFTLFVSELGKLGITVTRGGRLNHLGSETTKAYAMNWLTSEYSRQGDTSCTTIALGDSPNDAEMLEQADYAGIVVLPGASPLKLKRTENLFISNKPAPDGWCENVEQLVPLVDKTIKMEA